MDPSPQIQPCLPVTIHVPTIHNTYTFPCMCVCVCTTRKIRNITQAQRRRGKCTRAFRTSFPIHSDGCKIVVAASLPSTTNTRLRFARFAHGPMGIAMKIMYTHRCATALVRRRVYIRVCVCVFRGTYSNKQRFAGARNFGIVHVYVYCTRCILLLLLLSDRKEYATVVREDDGNGSGRRRGKRKKVPENTTPGPTNVGGMKSGRTGRARDLQPRVHGPVVNGHARFSTLCARDSPPSHAFLDSSSPPSVGCA